MILILILFLLEDFNLGSSRAISAAWEESPWIFDKKKKLSTTATDTIDQCADLVFANSLGPDQGP